MINNTTSRDSGNSSVNSTIEPPWMDQEVSYSLSHPVYIVQLAQITLTLITNFVLMVVITNRKTLRRKKSCKLMYNLLLVDCLLSSLYFIAFFFHLRLKNQLSSGLLLLTICALICLVWDRYLEIEDPFTYETNAKMFVLVQVISSWLLSIALTTLLVFTHASQFTLKVFQLALVGSAAISFIPMNSFVYWIARKHARSALRYTVETNPTIKKEMKRLKSTYMPITICSVFCVCWVPHTVSDVVRTGVDLPCHGLIQDCLERVAVFSCTLYPLFFAAFCHDTKKVVEKACVRCGGDGPTSLDGHCSCTSSKRRSRSTHTLSVECKEMTGEENTCGGPLEY